MARHLAAEPEKKTGKAGKAGKGSPGQVRKSEPENKFRPRKPHISSPEALKPGKINFKAAFGIEKHEEGSENYAFDVTAMVRMAICFTLFDITMLLRGKLGVAADYVFVIIMLASGLKTCVLSAGQIVEAKFGSPDIYIFICTVVLAVCFSTAAGAALILFYCLFMYLDSFMRARYCCASSSDADDIVFNVVDADDTREIKEDELAVGDIIRIYSGETVHIDGVVADGSGDITNALTGSKQESVHLEPGCTVLSGSHYSGEHIDIRVTNVHKDSFEHAAASGAFSENVLNGSKEQKFAKAARIAAIIRPVVMLIALILSLMNGNWSGNFQFAAGVVVVSCFEFLYVGEMIRMVTCLKSAASYGVYFMSRNALARFSKTNTFIFSMTGTLTDGKFAVIDVVPVGLGKSALVAIATVAEKYSSHPIAESLRNACSSRIDSIPGPVSFEEIPGRGVASVMGGKTVLVGNAELMNDNNVECRVPDKPGTAIHVAIDNQYAGYILLSDKVRDHAFEMIDDLRFRGAERIVMLTGNVASTAKKAGIALNIDMIKSELNHIQKLNSLDYLSSSNSAGNYTAYVASMPDEKDIAVDAQVGIALGGSDFPHLVNSADILCSGSNIMNLPAAYSLAVGLPGIDNILELVCLGIAALLVLGMLIGLLKIGVALAAAVLVRFGVYFVCCDFIRYFIRRDD